MTLSANLPSAAPRGLYLELSIVGLHRPDAELSLLARLKVRIVHGNHSKHLCDRKPRKYFHKRHALYDFMVSDKDSLVHGEHS